jgi:hypothetical protein
MTRVKQIIALSPQVPHSSPLVVPPLCFLMYMADDAISECLIFPSCHTVISSSPPVLQAVTSQIHVISVSHLCQLNPFVRTTTCQKIMISIIIFGRFGHFWAAAF